MGVAKLRIAGLFVVAIAAGMLLATVLFRPRSEARQRAQAHEQPPGASADLQHLALLGPAFDRARLNNLEAKVSALEAGGPAHPPAGAQSPAPPHPTGEQQLAMMQEDYRRHQDLVSKIMSSPRSPGWANDMERKFDDEFKKLPVEMHAEYRGTDCRTDSCVVRMAWPSRQAADSALMTMMALTGLAGCAREVALPPPSGGGENQPVEAAVVVDCKEKNQGSRRETGAMP